MGGAVYKTEITQPHHARKIPFAKTGGSTGNCLHISDADVSFMWLRFRGDPANAPTLQM